MMTLPLISQGKFPATCGVQLVAVARHVTGRRRAGAGYLKYPAACGEVL